LRFEHPKLADLSCGDCQKWVYEIPSGDLQTYESGNGERSKVQRSGPPPCHLCPKISPDHEHQFILSDYNERLLILHRRLRSGVWQLTAEQRQDGLLADNFAIIDALLTGAENRKNREHLAESIAQVFLRVLGR
jgi:hypothetical protein